MGFLSFHEKACNFLWPTTPLAKTRRVGSDPNKPREKEQEMKTEKELPVG